MARRFPLHCRGLAVAGCLWLAVAAPAHAAPAVGVIAGQDSLVIFDTATPGRFTSVAPITGLGIGERMAGIDYRYLPVGDGATAPGLFGIGVVDAGATDQVRLMRIDIGTGAATPVGAAITLTSGAAYGVDFIPTSDRLRVVNSSDENARINPNNGFRSDAPTNDTDLVPAGQSIPAAAHDRVAIPPTLPATGSNSTLFALRPSLSQLLTIGGINQSPSPNGGQLLNPQPLGITVDATAPELVNFDIDPAGTLFATFRAAGSTGLYTVLTSGPATLVGPLAAPLSAFAIVPGSVAAVIETAPGVTEGQSSVVTVIRSGATTSTLTVNYATGAGTAGTGDYTPASGTLTFAPGESTKSFVIATTPDTIDEPAETVTYSLSAPGPGGSLGAAAAGTLTIVDDDPAPPAVAPPDRTAPRITVSGLRTTMTRAQFLRGVRFNVTPSETSALTAELHGSLSSARISAFELRLASRSLRRAAGRRTIILRPLRRLVGAPRRRVRVRLAVAATDAAGNVRRTTRTITVRPR